MPDLRKEFFNQILPMAKKDKKIVLLVGDLGFSFCEKFQKELPEQFINCGIAEQNMMGVAVGMSYEGLKPYVYSGTIFLLMRPYEFVRDDVCYNNANVKLIGTGASQFLGFTHNLEGNENEEDILKNLPNLERFYPKDKNELKNNLIKSYNNKKPAFIMV